MSRHDEKIDELDRTRPSDSRVSELVKEIFTKAPPIAVLLVQRGKEIGKRYLINDKSLVMGRNSRKADLVILGDEEVSSAHIRIDRRDDTFHLVDIESLNGTRVNDRVLKPESPVELREGDRIIIGQTVLKFTMLDALDADFQDQIDSMMNIDQLTGLPVKRVFDFRLEVYLEDARTSGKQMCVLMMDMDGLKAINDANGHQVGAGTISQVGKLIGKFVDSKGAATRFGGDEFTALLYPCTPEQGLEAAEHIRAEVERQPVTVGSATVHPTISIGIASMPRDGDQRGQLIRAADEALYRAKAKGRNCASE